MLRVHRCKTGLSLTQKRNALVYLAMDVVFTADTTRVLAAGGRGFGNV
jgi:hypothetical protein